jgi:hypothetical protein
LKLEDAAKAMSVRALPELSATASFEEEEITEIHDA